MQRFSQAGIELQKYLRWPLNAWTAPEAAFKLAMDRLRQYPNFIELQGAVIELLTIATNTAPEFQGLLLSSGLVPMEMPEIASILRVDGRKALVIVTRIISVGILERVVWPPEGSDGTIPQDKSLRLLQDVASAGKKAAGKGGQKGRSRGENADDALKEDRRSEISAAQAKIEVSGPAHRPPSEEAQGDKAAEAGETAEAQKLTCPNCGHVGKPAKPLEACETLSCTNCGKTIKLRSGTAANPSTSMSSTSPDAGAGLAQPPSGSQASPQARPASIIRFAEVQQVQGHKYSTAANDFGQEVCAAGGFVSYDGGEYANEIAHWARLYDDELVTLSAFDHDKVKRKLFRIAAEVRTGKRRPENPAGYLERVLQNAIRDRKRATGKKAGTG